MFAHVRKWFPWRERARRKKEFLNQLKGSSLIHINKNVPVGAIFIVFNHPTGDMDTFCNIDTNKWVSFGSGKNIVTTYSKRSLEMHLSKLIRKVGSDHLVEIINDCGYIKRTKLK